MKAILKAGYVVLAIACTVVINAHAEVDENEQARPVVIPEMSTTDLLNLLVSEGVISKEAALKLVNTLRRRAENASQTSLNSGADEIQQAEDQVIVPYIPSYIEERIAQSIKQELADEVVQQAKEEGLSTPEWVERITLTGDVRVRYSGEYYPNDNPHDAAFNYNEVNDSGSASDAGREAYVNVNDDRTRLQGRARVKLTAKPTDVTEIGIRITSGNAGNPVSANQTLGRYGSKWESSFDLAYVKYQTKRLILNAGRFENPWLNSDLIWDNDMTFEGLFAQIVPFKLGNESTYWNTYFNLGAFPIQEIHQFQREEDVLDAPDDKWLYSLGLGSEFQFSSNHELDLALTYHEYKNITGIRNLPGNDSQNPSYAPYLQWFNVTQNIAVALPGDEQQELYGLAGEFELINFVLLYDYTGFEKYKLSFGAHYVQNLAWDTDTVSELALPGEGITLPDRDVGYQIEMGFGTKTKGARGDWGVSVAYRYLEGDAVVDAFADSDFLLGGTNAQGYILKGYQYMSKNISLELSVISADEIDFPITATERDLREDALLLDVYARF